MYVVSDLPIILKNLCYMMGLTYPCCDCLCLSVYSFVDCLRLLDYLSLDCSLFINNSSDPFFFHSVSSFTLSLKYIVMLCCEYDNSEIKLLSL